jgi:hypothetical protein
MKGDWERYWECPQWDWEEREDHRDERANYWNQRPAYHANKYRTRMVECEVCNKDHYLLQDNEVDMMKYTFGDDEKYESKLGHLKVVGQW